MVKALTLVAGACLGWAALAGAAPPDYDQDCTTSGCHDAYAKLPVVHDPVGSDACDSCHTAKDGEAHAFELTEAGGDLCTQCHDEFEGKVVHDPAGDGLCLSCHDPHATSAVHLLRVWPQTELCAECHDDVTEGHAYLHGPVAAGSCTACHQPHAGEHAQLLRGEGPSLCLACHAALRDGLSAYDVVHAPVEDDCTSCHNAHGGDNARFLTGGLPDLCVACHDDIGDAIDAKVKHAPVASGASCAACHDAHAAPRAHLLAKDPVDLCLDCHEKAVKAGEAKLPDLRAQLKAAKAVHAPVSDGECGQCHEVHGSAHDQLLGEAYPTSFYIPFAEDAYALCFECHDPDLAVAAQTDSATGFRNGEQNLHYVHVNRERKGRTCRVCHDPHASPHERIVKDEVPFGTWQVPIGFTPNDNGGSCASGCHRVYRYHREEAVRNVPDGA